MNNLSNFSTQELEEELKRRGKTISPNDGCMRVCEKCTCRR